MQTVTIYHVYRIEFIHQSIYSFIHYCYVPKSSSAEHRRLNNLSHDIIPLREKRKPSIPISHPAPTLPTHIYIQRTYQSFNTPCSFSPRSFHSGFTSSGFTDDVASACDASLPANTATGRLVYRTGWVGGWRGIEGRRVGGANRGRRRPGHSCCCRRRQRPCPAVC